MPWSKIKAEVQEPEFSQETESGGRVLSYPEAVREAFHEALKHDARVFLMGQDVDAPGGMSAPPGDSIRNLAAGGSSIPRYPKAP